MKEQNYIGLPFMPDVRAIAEQNNVALERVFKGRIKGRFLIDIKDQVMKDLGLESLLKYYDFRWSDERMITGIGEAAEYDICRMIVGIHRAHSVFLSDDEIWKNERSRRYRQQLVLETMEKSGSGSMAVYILEKIRCYMERNFYIIHYHMNFLQCRLK